MKNKLIHAILFSLFTAIIYSLLFIGYQIIFNFNGDGGYNSISILYGIIYSFGHGFEFALFIFVFCILTLFLPKYARPILWITPSLLLLIYFVVDIFVYKQFRYNINFSMLQLFFSSASKEIFNFPTIMYIQFIFILLLLVGLLAFGYKITIKLSNKIKKIHIITLCSFFISFVILYHGMHAYAYHKNNIAIMQVAYILPQSYPLRIEKILTSKGIYNTEEHITLNNIKKMNYPHTFPAISDNISTYNIVLIVIESWRFDAMNNEITPNISKFSKNSIVFTNHNANANQTRQGIFSIFYGIPGVYWDAALFSGTTPVLMDVLQQKEYQLGIFASSALTSPEFDRTVFAKVPNLRLRTNGETANIRDRQITSEFIEFLDNISSTKPFFGYLFYDSPHSYSFDESMYPPKFKPYSKNKNYLNIDDKDILFNLYKNSVGFTDMLVGDVIRELEKRNLLNNTVVIITGDHGEEFDDLNKNYYGHLGNYSKYQTQVPFIISMPKNIPTIYDYETSHIDIVPTIIKHIFNSDTNIEEYSTGYDLFDNTTRPFIFIKGEEYAVKYNDKYIIMKKYGLPEVRDMQYNLLNEKPEPDIINQIFKQLQKFR